MENLKIDILTARVKDVATTTEPGKFECVVKAIGDEVSVNRFFDYVSKWPPNDVVEHGQADCAIESGCKRRIKGWGCYDNCRSYTPAT